MAATAAPSFARPSPRRAPERPLGATPEPEAAAATPELMEMIESAGPFGQAAPAPRYAFSDLLLDSVATMGDGHLRAAFRVPGQKPLEAVAWGAMQSPLGPALLGAKGRRFHVAGKLELSHWGGRTRVRLRMDDAFAL